MKLNQKLVYAVILILFLSCTGKQKQQEETKWSIKMAEAVMQRNDSLIYYNNRTNAAWSYDVAMLGLAIDKLGESDPKYSQYMQDFIDMMVDSTGRIVNYYKTVYNIDLIRPAVNLLKLYKRTGNELYKKTIIDLAEAMKNHPKTVSGGFWHKQRYPWQMWLDGIYMGSPFLTEYAKEFNDPKWFDFVAHQITLIYDKTVDPQTGLLYHAWDESKEQRWSNPVNGQSPHFWSRAMGWYMMALVDVLDFFPENHPKRAEIIEILNKTSEALLKVQDPESGVWYQVLDQGGKEGNYLEASGSAMYIYAFAKGAKKGYLDESYLEKANSAFDNFLKTFVIEDEDSLPSIINICGSCGLGGDPYRDGSYEYYVNETIVKNDSKGVGPFILAAIELDR